MPRRIYPSEKFLSRARTLAQEHPKQNFGILGFLQ